MTPISCLRIYLRESARHGPHPLYEWLVLEARAQGLAGATVFRSPLGFGASHQLHNAAILRLSGDLPMLVECVDERSRLLAFFARVQPHLQGGLATLQDLQLLHPPTLPPRPPPA